MNKLLIAVPVVAGLAGASWAGATLYGGKEASAAYERVVADLNDALGLHFANSSYTAGFLSSEATTDVRMADSPDATVLARLHHVIEHSPVETGANAGLSAARVTTTISTNDVTDPKVQKALAAFAGDSPATLLSRVGFDGEVNNTLTVAAFTWNGSGEQQVQSEPAEWNFVVDQNGSVNGEGSWGGAVLNDPSDGTSVTIASATDQFDYRRDASGIYAGEYTMRVPEVISDRGMPGLEMGGRDITVSTRNDVVDGLMSGNMLFSVADVLAPVAVDSADIRATYGGLDTRQFETLQALSAQMNLARASGDDSAASDPFAKYMRQLGTAILPGAYLGYELELANAGGAANASATATFEGDGSPSGRDLLSSPNATVGDLVAAMKVEISADVPNAALAMTPAGMFVNPAMLAPWVVPEGESLTSSIVLDDLIVDANGQPMALKMMAGDLLQQPLDLSRLSSM